MRRVGMVVGIWLLLGSAHALGADERSDIAILQTVQSAQERHLEYIDKRMDAVDAKLDALAGDSSEIKGIGIGLGVVLTLLSGGILTLQLKRKGQ